MRIRRKPWARPELAACPFCIDEEDKPAVIGRWQEQFARRQPLWLELGCGKGQFIAQLAAEHPEVNFIAIDIKSEVLVLTKRNIEQAYAQRGLPIDNVRILSQDIERIGMILSPDDRVERIYINFCNPWTEKARHHKRRLTHTRQLRNYQQFLSSGGEIWFKTDDDVLFDASLAYLESCGFSLRYLTRDLHQSGFSENIPTEHEEMFAKDGVKIKFLIAVNGGGVSV
ncbi:tRNA (guanosine(46)-N7)-methyltransferase TrmB [Zongyangia hominis]|uniref:tRNA (guanine-N(7)-)-methyltransferase n=1 Tax=Zongyangia hominis TaxID=2763677 RepID=A0A926EEN8_9FIRM|nr:tRNA (guanosine(46)-N7)-methyltransferase TrmB [Zongyangia hominis]MBC8571069.1 tRNA (guanosine(46)-N7)-methyltransferase TrmB [Zongyangia hominis]